MSEYKNNKKNISVKPNNKKKSKGGGGDTDDKTQALLNALEAAVKKSRSSPSQQNSDADKTQALLNALEAVHGTSQYDKVIHDILNMLTSVLKEEPAKRSTRPSTYRSAKQSAKRAAKRTSNSSSSSSSSSSSDSSSYSSSYSSSDSSLSPRNRRFSDVDKALPLKMQKNNKRDNSPSERSHMDITNPHIQIILRELINLIKNPPRSSPSRRNHPHSE